MEDSKISWTDHTFNPWMGCTKYGPGCDHCYAETLMDHRYHKVKWGKGEPRQRTAPSYWRQPVTWNDQPWVECMDCHWRGDARKAPWKRDPPGVHPLGSDWRTCPSCKSPMLKETRARVFCASLADVFDAEVDPAWRSDLFDLIRRTPRLDWLLLTKRIGNAHRMIDEALIEADRDGKLARPLHNVWLGATVVNQPEADRDIPKLLATPARVRFLSMEPLLGPVTLPRLCDAGSVPGPHGVGGVMCERCGGSQRYGCLGIDWVIVGGESGANARPFHIPWARSIGDQCKAAGVPFHVKQLGAEARGWCAARLHSGDPDLEEPDYCDVEAGHEGARCAGRCVFIANEKGANPAEWPLELRLQEFP